MSLFIAFIVFIVFILSILFLFTVNHLLLMMAVFYSLSAAVR